MSNQQKTALRSYYDGLLPKQQSHFRNRVLEETRAGYNTFYNWIKGGTPCYLVRKKINEIAGFMIYQD